MTANRKTTPRTHDSYRASTALLCLAGVFLLCLLLRNSEVAINYMRTGLRLCASTVIPSLFPFMVISELLVDCGFGQLLGRLPGRPMERLFGISGDAGSALLLGAVCGFPVGAKTAISLYDRGILSKREVERVMAFCNVPSSGFLIGAVGVSMYGDRRFGIFLFFTALLSALVIGLAIRILFPLPKEAPVERPHSHLRLPRIDVTVFTRAISSATASILSVCACVLFFTAVIGCLSSALYTAEVPRSLEALLFCLFEISSGVSAAASLDSSVISATICGFAIGWSGISVHCQILSLGGDRGISFRPYFLAKISQGLLCAAASFFYAKRFSLSMSSVSQGFAEIPVTARLSYTLPFCLVFLICTMLYCKKIGKHR